MPITTLISQAKAQGNAAVQRTLQHVLMHTATTAFSEGAKTTFRHMGQAMNDRFGPFSTFFTTNFADTYHVLTQVLTQGAFEPLGRRPLNILQDSPPMPTPQEMHKIVAARPMVQANLFLFLDAITHQNLLCARRVFLGRRKYDPCFRWAREPLTEDDFTSSGDVGISAFLRSLIKALEAQGRGFAHGHENHHSEPRTKAIDLVMLFLGRSHGMTGATEPCDDRDRELLDWMARHRDAHLRDAATKQFDSAVESGRQFGCTDLKEVFTTDEKNGAASTAELTTMGRRVCRMWRSSQRQIQGTCFAKDTRRNTRAGHSDMHTATCRSRVLQRRGSRHISKPAASIAFPTWTKTGMLQRHWLLLLQSSVVTATLVGSIQRLRT